MNMKILITGTAVIFAAGLAGWLALGDGSPGEDEHPAVAQGAPLVQVRLPEELSLEARIGQRGFEAKCAACHGGNAAGRNGLGPPLVHRIYEPSHHSDGAFLVAAINGVRAHHWTFGNMPALEDLTQADIASITTYVRELQRANGIE